MGTSSKMAQSMRYTTMNSLYIVMGCMLLTCVSSVDKGNFKTCDQSGFCKRHRAVPQDQSPYVAVLSSVEIIETKMKLQIVNTKNNVRLNVELTGLQQNMVRLKISETNPLRPRYEPAVGDVLVSEPKQDAVEVLKKDDNSITMGAPGDKKMVIHSKPFRVDFLVKDEPVFILNTHGLLKYEHFREKPGSQEAPAEEEKKEGDGEPETQEQPPEEDKKEEDKKEEEEPDMWEETFKGHQDTKPYGSSSVGVDISFPGFEHVYGIPEHADSLALKSTKDTDPYRLYNLDVFEYELDSKMALYGSVPVMLAHSEKRTVGVFWQNAAETWIDISNNKADKSVLSKVVDFVKGDDEEPQVDTHWFSESGLIDVFFMFGPAPADVFSQYATLTGSTPLPPLFALAYHQSRWNYNDEEDVRSVDDNFDKHDIPYDVLWLDIEHTDGKKYFTWDKLKFPNSQEMIMNISAKGRKMVTIIDPHIKRESGYKIHTEAQSNGYYVKNKDSNEYDGWCWPGSSGWLDFLNPEIRKYWASKYALNEYEGSTLDLYTWNDMNEPSVFNGPEITMHKDAKHFGDWEHRDVHNIYGMLNHAATAQGQVDRSDGKLRPFVLSRAFFAGTQKYGAVWTGDNTGEWGHLKASTPMILSLQITGITMSGADVGGFFKNPDNELLTRWYQAGAYQPFFRAHAHLDTRRREPWLLPEENMKVIRDAIRARYSLLPYWYTQFYLSEKSGMPVMRPLWVEYPTEKPIFTEDNTFMIGSALLVHPVTAPGTPGVNIHLPGPQERWYDVETYAPSLGGNIAYVNTPLSKIPVFQKGGTIVPRRERIRRASSLTRNDPYTLIICLNREGTAVGNLYIDDYHTFQYKNGEYTHREFIFENKKLENKNADPRGTYIPKSWVEKIVIVGVNKPRDVELTEDGQTKSLEFSYNPDNGYRILTIRKPGVNISKEWSITLQ